MAQLVSASGLGPEGPVFESQYPDKIQKQLLNRVVAFFSFRKLCIIRTHGFESDISAQRKIPVDLYLTSKKTPLFLEVDIVKHLTSKKRLLILEVRAQSRHRER